jgi:hypothetical protein
LEVDCPFEKILEELLVSLTDREFEILFNWDHMTDQGQFVSRITDDNVRAKQILTNKTTIACEDGGNAIVRLLLSQM